MRAAAMVTALRTALIAASICLPTLAAAEDKSDLTLNHKLIEASVTVEAALKAYPGLFDDLLAEGRKELVKWRVQAEKDRKELPDIFREGRRYSYQRTYAKRSEVGRYVSVLRYDYFDGGGAHPNRVTNTILWDSDAKKRISIRPLFSETAENGPTMTALAKAIRAALATEKKARDIEVKDPDTDDALSSVKPSLLKIGGVALAPSDAAGKSSGLICYFSPYDVGAYVEGDYIVLVPWTVFKDFLSPEGAALFGGDRPKGDADKD